jgi:hypothetical protein
MLYGVMKNKFNALNAPFYEGVKQQNVLVIIAIITLIDFAH